MEVQKKSVKISPAPIDESSDGKIIFTAEEWSHLEKEIAKQIDETGNIDYRKAINNARYLAKIDESIKQFEEGKVLRFTDEEWEKFVSEQELSSASIN